MIFTWWISLRNWTWSMGVWMDLILASIPRYTTHINPFFFVSSDMIKSIAFVKKTHLLTFCTVYIFRTGLTMMELDLEHAKVDKWQVKVEHSPWSWQLTRSTWNQLPDRRGGTPWMAVDPFAVLVALEWWRLVPRKCCQAIGQRGSDFALSTMRAALCEASPRRKCIWNWRWCTGGYYNPSWYHESCYQKDTCCNV